MISESVTVLVLLLRSSGQFPYQLVPIGKKNVRSTMLSYSFHKEVILCPAPQSITVKYNRHWTKKFIMNQESEY
jgi:hypothetical protein